MVRPPRLGMVVGKIISHRLKLCSEINRKQAHSFETAAFMISNCNALRAHADSDILCLSYKKHNRLYTESMVIIWRKCQNIKEEDKSPEQFLHRQVPGMDPPWYPHLQGQTTKYAIWHTWGHVDSRHATHWRAFMKRIPSCNQSRDVEKRNNWIQLIYNWNCLVFA